MVPLLIAAIALLIGWFVMAAIRAYRTTQHEFLSAVRDLGFIPAGTAPELESRLASLYAPGTGKGDSAPDLKLDKVFSKRLGDGEMFVFDLIDGSGDSNTRTEQQAVAVVSPLLDLPSFVMIPKTGSSGMFAPLANRMLAWMASRYGTPVELPNDPMFSKHYLVSARDPEAAHRFLTPDRTRALAGVRYAGLHAGGDVFAVSTLQPRRGPVRQKLGERIDHATRIFSAFRA